MKKAIDPNPRAHLDTGETPVLRFVVLRHEDIDDPHFDFMFETAPGSVLSTWRFDTWPITSPITVQPINDHRREYLEYEGPISGHRGSVRRIISGECFVRKFGANYIGIYWVNPASGGIFLHKEMKIHSMAKFETYWEASRL